VSELKQAWQTADAHARKCGTRHLPATEQKAIRQAHKLLSAALSEDGGTAHERRAAASRAAELLDGVLAIPPQAEEALKQSLPLPRGTRGSRAD